MYFKIKAYLCIAVQGEPRKRNLKRLKGSKKKQPNF